MKYQDISPTMRRFIGAMEGFLKLGFEPADLFCQTARSAQANGALSAFVLLKTQGKEFLMEVGTISSEPVFAEEYRKICEAINAKQVSQTDLDRMWQESECHRFGSDFIMALLNKGFEIPNAGTIHSSPDRKKN